MSNTKQKPIYRIEICRVVGSNEPASQSGKIDLNGVCS